MFEQELGDVESVGCCRGFCFSNKHVRFASPPLGTRQMYSMPEQSKDCAFSMARSSRFDFHVHTYLQAVQPSKEIRREQLENDFRINQQYLQNASHHRIMQPTASSVESLQTM